ncbi:protein SOSEKI 3 isoform X2 [Daucus carota subsp. sativus]|uniref:protein SOSEKI 3 isoform X2 n=1 Tax=Daucus carota subsp. sativus TaxID=79200 RepID=UPI0030831878
MEERMKKYRQVSPERAKVWTEKSPKYHQQQPRRKVSVVYYLSRNRQLEHPHFIEVSLSSPDGLYLRDVIDRLNVLRGRGMASMYSWSCKRSYRTGFVWHDLCEDDLIHPAHGNEYVLKGSELFDEPNSVHFSPAGNIRSHNLKQLPDPAFSRSQDDSPSSETLTERDTKQSLDDELSPPVQRSSSSVVSPDSKVGKASPSSGSLSLTEYKIYKSEGLANASTQTEDNMSRPRETCTRGVSTEDVSVGHEHNDAHQIPAQCVKETSEICRDPVSPPTCSSSASSSGGLSATKFPSPLFSTSVMFGDLDCLSENPRLMSQRMEDKEYFSGSLVETSMPKEGLPSLKRSSSYNDRTCDLSKDSVEDKEKSTSSKCIPRAIKVSLGKQPKSESMRSPVSEGPRVSSSDRVHSARITSPCVSNAGSGRITDPGMKQSKKADSFRSEKDSVIKIEERLASGARVIIHSQAP